MELDGHTASDEFGDLEADEDGLTVTMSAMGMSFDFHVLSGEENGVTVVVAGTDVPPAAVSQALDAQRERIRDDG